MITSMSSEDHETALIVEDNSVRQIANTLIILMVTRILGQR